ncbi:MAG TPA: hypothetical protein VEA44_00815 [Caulobacter sp.]|nr:hypothetical protein [Caulobacter sp.]
MTTPPHRIDAGLPLLLLLVLGTAFGAAVLVLSPNPFADLGPGERPSCLLMLFKVGGGLILLFAGWRLLTWSTWLVWPDALERRGWFGRRRFTRASLTEVELDVPEGIPPAFILTFTDGVARFVAQGLKPADRAALRAFAA